MQPDLFSIADGQQFDLGDGAFIRYFPQWMSEDQSRSLYASIMETVAWSQPKISMAGKQISIPRLQVWCGDSYLIYSGQAFSPQPWPKGVRELCDSLQNVDGSTTYNSVLINRYRNGKDSVSWHADDEPELGVNPTIASLSLGASRRFLLKKKKTGIGAGSQRVVFMLNSCDLLIMSGRCQANWLHCLPKTARPVGERINLTFRQMFG